MIDRSDNSVPEDELRLGVLPDALPLDAAESQLLRALRSAPAASADRDAERAPGARPDTVLDLNRPSAGLQQDGLTPVFTEP